MSQLPVLDHRLNAYRDDLADAHLRDDVIADAFVTGKPARVISHFVDIVGAPSPDAGLHTQFLYGHDVQIFDMQGDWVWLQGDTDGYVGYGRRDGFELIDASSSPPTHMVSAPRTFLYSTADLKSPRSGYRSIGSKLRVVDWTATRGTDYAIVESGEAVIARHLIELDKWFSDPVSIAETLLHAPYLWGGNSGFGLDCSGLVSLAHLLCGNSVLRDSDMQAAQIGTEIPLDKGRLQRGDLIFWNGHVGMMSDAQNMIHANGNTMNVALEPLADAIERIGYLYGQPTIVRRP